MAQPAITLADIEEARDAISDVVRNTPLKRSTTLSNMTGAEIHLKLENFQRTGSFKVRGATNKIYHMTGAEKEAGVVAASAGNHAQGVAYAATKAGVSAHVFMPENASVAKVRATKGYGAQIHLIGRDYQEAYEAAVEFQKESGAVFVHAFEDKHIMAGQGTLGLEIAEEFPEIDTVLIPIGGGGLFSGVATALKAKIPNIRIVGVQAKGASTVAESLAKGSPFPIDEAHTMADGIACRKLGDMTFECIQRLADQIVTVDEAQIASAILFLLERTKTTVEGAGAVSLAAALSGDVDLKGRNVCVICSGGNIDSTLLSRIIDEGLVKEGRVAVFSALLPDKPGAIADLLTRIANKRANVKDVRHDRYRHGVPLDQTYVEVHVETYGRDHANELLVALQEAGYDDIRLG